LGRLNSVEIPFQVDVHQDEVGLRLFDLPNGLLAPRGGAGNGEAGPGEKSSDEICDRRLILNDKNPDRGHDAVRSEDGQ